MSLFACFAAAARQGLLTAEEAEYFQKREAELREQLGDLKTVRDRLAKEMELEALHKKKAALMNAALRDAVMDEARAYRTTRGDVDLAEAFLNMHENEGTRGTYLRDAAYLKETIARSHQGMMGTALRELKRGALTGDRRRQGGILGNARVIGLMEETLRELHGQDTGNTTAKTIAKEWERVSESLRERFNAAGGAIGKLSKWGLVQHHDAEAMLKVGKARWVERLQQPGVLDRDRMRRFDQVGPMTDGELQRFLEGAYDSILEEHFNQLPDGTRRAALFTQRADHRNIHFTNADQWLAYAREFGRGGDIFGDMMGHIEGMAKDIAHMERFGPSPETNREHVKRVILEEVTATGDQAAIERAKKLLYKSDQMWEVMRGQSPVNTAIADRMATARSFITATALPGAILSSLTDPAMGQDTRLRLGMGFARANIGTVMAKTFGELFTLRNREEAVAAGLGLDSGLNVMRTRAKEVTQIDWRAWSGFVADRVLTTTLLSPWTQAGKHMIGLDMMPDMSRLSGQSFGDLSAGLRRSLESNGIGWSEWEKIRTAPKHDVRGATWLRHNEIAAHAGRDLAERYLAMILRETRHAVPEGNVYARSITGGQPAGTLAGELMRSVGQFKGYSLAVVSLHGLRIGRAFVEGNKANTIALAATLAITATMLGAMVIALKDMRDGRDPRRLLDDKWGIDPKLWAAAWLQSGGLGIYGDFLFSEVNRHGDAFATNLAGPLAGRVSHTLEGLNIAKQKLIDGKNVSATSWAIKGAKQNVPFWAHPMTKVAFERQVWDQLEIMMDREAHTRFRRDIMSRRKDYGQDYWWAPGQSAPARGPDLSRLGASR